jgi:acylphosphatase
MADVTEHLEAHVIGRVQGVGFRHFTIQQARRLGVEGWVRNEPDGSVRVVAQGPAPALDVFLERLHRGPAGARVDAVDVDRTEASGTMSGFTLRHL